MKILLFPLFLLSVSLTAQEKQKIKPLSKADTVESYKDLLSENLELNSDKPPKELYKIMTFKPKDSVMYLALKEPEKDYSQYKILNPIAPEKKRMNIKDAPKQSK
jgi:hypothetical protein